jgi:hypothetical protein
MPVNIKMCVYCIYNNPNQTNPECITASTRPITNPKNAIALAVAVAEKETIKQKRFVRLNLKRRTERGELEKERLEQLEVVVI